MRQAQSEINMAQHSHFQLNQIVKLLAVVAAAATLSACGGKKETPPTQVAARVNKADITVHQINFRLQQNPNIKPEQMDAATKAVLEQLVDQQLAIQKAEELKLDRDPRIVQALEAARREVLARAYIEQIVQGVPKPDENSVRRYFDEHPELFENRRVYSLQEVLIAPTPEQAEAVKAKIAAVKNAGELATWLKAENIRASGNQAVRPAEQIPLDLLAKLAKLEAGQSITVSETPVVRVVYVAAVRKEPVAFDRAKPAIEQFLITDARRKTVENSVKALRTAAQIQYEGKFAALAASQPTLSTTRNAQFDVNIQASGAQVSLPTSSASGVEINLSGQTAPGVEVSLPNSSASGVEVKLEGQGTAVDPNAVKKGLGLK